LVCNIISEELLVIAWHLQQMISNFKNSL